MESWRQFENETIKFFEKVLDVEKAHSKNVAGYQIDCWAEKNEYIFIVECKNSEPLNPEVVTRRDYRKDILEFAAKKSSLEKHIQSLPRRKKPIWIFCTNGSVPIENNYALAAEHGILVWTSGHLELLKKLKKSLGEQLFWQVIKEAGYSKEYFDSFDRKTFRYPALPRQAMFGGQEVDVYTFFMPVKDLLPLSYVYRIKEDEAESYQRLLSPKKVKLIGEFIDKGNTINTSILVNLPSDSKFFVQNNAEHYESSFGFLTIPKIRNSIRIIDGQHRLYGFMHSKDSEQQIPVIALLGASGPQEAQAFIDINQNQTTVPKNELYVILAKTDPDGAGFLPDLVILMNKDGLFKGRVQIAGLRVASFSAGLQRLSLSTMVTVLSLNAFIGTNQKIGTILNTSDYISIDYAKKHAQNLLEYFFKAAVEIAKKESTKWENDFIFTNPGFQILMPVLKQIAIYSNGSAGIKSSIDELVPHLTSFFRKNTDNIDEIRQDSSAASRSKYSFEMMLEINKINPSFAHKYINKRKEINKVNHEADVVFGPIQVAHDLEKEIKEFIINLLNEKIGPGWFVKSENINSKLKSKAIDLKNVQKNNYYEMGEESEDRHEIYFLPMGDVLKIVRANSQIFREIIRSGSIQFEADLDIIKTVGDKRHEGSNASISNAMLSQFNDAEKRIRTLLKTLSSK